MLPGVREFIMAKQVNLEVCTAIEVLQFKVENRFIQVQHDNTG